MEAQKVPIKVEAKLLLPREEYTLMARKHFEKKGYRVHSGLQFGSDLVLYADSPDRVHSDFCVHVIPEDTPIDWRTIQTLVRSMPDLHKTLILVNVKRDPDEGFYSIEELAIASEHAPFRYKNATRTKSVGSQFKR